MPYIIKAGEAKGGINLAPASTIEEILQNISMILSTIKGTAPLYRDFGIAARSLDKPMPIAKAILTAEIIEAIEQYEPRAEILNVTFGGDEMAGKLTPSLEVKINA